jgi:phage anti-repressor protein
MKDLIRIDFNNNLKVNSVDARELYKVLEVKTRFNDWIKARLDDTMAESNVDFFITEKKAMKNTEQLSSENVGGIAKNKAVNYKLSLNLAKEIAMLERNEVGKKVRKYFIQCESELLSKPKTVKRVKGDEPSDLNRLVNGLLERQIKHRKPCHFDYSNLAREVNIATFGHHEKDIRQHMTEDEAYVLRKKLTQAGLAIADGLSKPKEIGEIIRTKELT